MYMYLNNYIIKADRYRGGLKYAIASSLFLHMVFNRLTLGFYELCILERDDHSCPFVIVSN